MYTTSSICCTGEGQSGCGQVRTEVVMYRTGPNPKRRGRVTQ